MLSNYIGTIHFHQKCIAKLYLSKYNSYTATYARCNINVLLTSDLL